VLCDPEGGGRLHLIVKTKAGVEVGLFVQDTGAWVAALQRLTG
jgi:hypothetical protein